VQKQLTEGLGAVDRSTDGCLGWITRHPVLDPELFAITCALRSVYQSIGFTNVH
jgi:hypothetical protein